MWTPEDTGAELEACVKTLVFLTPASPPCKEVNPVSQEVDSGRVGHPFSATCQLHVWWLKLGAETYIKVHPRRYYMTSVSCVKNQHFSFCLLPQFKDDLFTKPGEKLSKS